MASVTKGTTSAGTLSADAISLRTAPQLTVTAGVAIAAGSFCYVDSAGLAQLCDATSANAKVAGIAIAAAAVNNPVTLFGIGVKLRYATGLTIGNTYFLDVTANAGGLSTVATTGDAVGVARAYSTTDIQVTRMI